MSATNPFLDPRRVQAALRGLELRPTRGMGQNFLIDPHALATIVVAANLQADDVVVEVGPGLGVLTWELTQRSRYVVAVELDKRLAARLHQQFRTTHAEPPALSPSDPPVPPPVLHLLQADILDVPPPMLLQQAQAAWQAHALPLPAGAALPPYKLVANLPYAITAPVLQHFLHSSHPPRTLTVLVQWEVAERITAAAGDLSVRALAIQLYAAPQIIARVPASSFIPAPAVDSAVLHLTTHTTPVIADIAPEALLRIIKAGFGQPRKKLANSLTSGLAGIGQGCPQAQVVAALHAAGVDPGRRPETLTLAEWAQVYRMLQGAGGGAG